MSYSILPHELREQIKRSPDFLDRAYGYSMSAVYTPLEDKLVWYAREILAWVWRCRYCDGENYRRNYFGHCECLGCGAPTDA